MMSCMADLFFTLSQKLSYLNGRNLKGQMPFLGHLRQTLYYSMSKQYRIRLKMAIYLRYWEDCTSERVGHGTFSIVFTSLVGNLHNLLYDISCFSIFSMFSLRLSLDLLGNFRMSIVLERDFQNNFFIITINSYYNHLMRSSISLRIS